MDQRRTLASWHALTSRLAPRRRLVVAGLIGVAVLCGIKAARPAPAPTSQVWVAARDLPGGEPIATGDVSTERLPQPDVPAGALRPGVPVVGRLLAAPVRRGEPLTDVRLLSPSLLSTTDPPGEVAVPVRVADGPATLALVHAGDLVDVIAAADPGDGAPAATSVVVHDVRVLATPAHDDSDGSSDEDGSADNTGLLIVAADDHQAAALAQAADGAQLSIAVGRP
jgi:pilus assembly protein CpaB